MLLNSSHLFQRVASFLQTMDKHAVIKLIHGGSHLFQRVASFLLTAIVKRLYINCAQFSSLSESGFIPTSVQPHELARVLIEFSSLSESGFIPTVTRPFLYSQL